MALFLRRRPGLVQLLQDGRAAAAGRAADLLQYKRDLLQYMADRPPRVSLDELQAAVPTPMGLLSDLACTVSVALGRSDQHVLAPWLRLCRTVPSTTAAQHCWLRSEPRSYCCPPQLCIFRHAGTRSGASGTVTSGRPPCCRASTTSCGRTWQMWCGSGAATRPCPAWWSSGPGSWRGGMQPCPARRAPPRSAEPLPRAGPARLVTAVALPMHSRACSNDSGSACPARACCCGSQGQAQRVTCPGRPSPQSLLCQSFRTEEAPRTIRSGKSTPRLHACPACLHNNTLAQVQESATRIKQRPGMHSKRAVRGKQPLLLVRGQALGKGRLPCVPAARCADAQPQLLKTRPNLPPLAGQLVRTRLRVGEAALLAVRAPLRCAGPGKGRVQPGEARPAGASPKGAQLQQRAGAVGVRQHLHLFPEILGNKSGEIVLGLRGPSRGVGGVWLEGAQGVRLRTGRQPRPWAECTPEPALGVALHPKTPPSRCLQSLRCLHLAPFVAPAPAAPAAAPTSLW